MADNDNAQSGRVIDWAHPDDIPEMVSLLYDLFDNHLTTPESLRPVGIQGYQCLLSMIGSGVLLSCKENGKLAGFVGGVFAPTPWTPHEPLLTELVWYVRPELRGKGVGRDLLEAYTAYANVCGAKAATMVVAANTTVPEDMLYKLGYKKLETTYIFEPSKKT